ncbi:MAG: SdpI family protein [Sedimentisphaerales bacterium]|nr:SdpI family protein [Sedimentisphaerales bacterium]
MKITKGQIVVIGLVLVAFALSIYFYPQMPERMASHWNARGEVDGYMSKDASLFIMPCVMAGIALLLYFVPYLDPLRRNIEKFRPYYEGFIIFMCIFMLAIQYHIILWNLGIQISTNIIIPVGIGLLFYYCGILCERAKRNWFIGIRTPWTLSSDSVWEKTHRVGGKLFKVSGVIALVGAAFQRYAIFFVIVPMIVVSVFTIVYSLVIYQQEKAG